MRNYQDAISQASKDFANAITNAGIGFRIAIITTSCGIDITTYCSDYYDYYGSYNDYESASRLLNSTGIIENNIELFKEKVVVGTEGSHIEAGIYNSERVLQSKAFGDSSDGLLTQLGMPYDKDTSLSIIMLSDEPNEYNQRAGKNFDIDNNLFVERGYRVYSIVNSDEFLLNKYEKTGQYDDLATKTGGLIADIRNTSSYSMIMNNIAQNATGDVGYKLKNKNIIESTIYVTINGNEITHNSNNGWKYVESYNSILFYGTALPKDGDKIKVSYWYAK
ncbi:hypothetical protein GSY74_02070 [Sulfurovum sp. bin170]|nr:hypothetical protein [Sulfurovum sp. bin170]